MPKICCPLVSLLFLSVLQWHFIRATLSWLLLLPWQCHFSDNAFNVNLSEVYFYLHSSNSHFELIFSVIPLNNMNKFISQFKVEYCLRNSALIQVVHTLLWDILFETKSSWLRWQLGSGCFIVPTWRHVGELAALFRQVTCTCTLLHFLLV